MEDSDAYTIGATVPLGSMTSLANYTSSTFDLNDGGDHDLSKAAVVAQYELSKRTLAYASDERKFDDRDDFATDKGNVTVFGLLHVLIGSIIEGRLSRRPSILLLWQRFSSLNQAVAGTVPGPWPWP